VGMVITNWLLPIFHGYAFKPIVYWPLVISHHKLATVIDCGLLAFRYFKV
jgi:hypothetical protein